MTHMPKFGNADTQGAYAAASRRGSNGVASFEGPGEALLAYAAAFEAQDAEFIATASTDASLVEIPMLKPNRLVGRDEIRSGHENAFASIKSAKFELSEPVEKDGVAIAEGVLGIERTNSASETHPLTMVAETESGALRRLSLYFDARFLRLWSDKTIL